MNTETVIGVGLLIYLLLIASLIYLKRITNAIYGSKHEQREREAFKRYLEALNKGRR